MGEDRRQSGRGSSPVWPTPRAIADDNPPGYEVVGRYLGVRSGPAEKNDPDCRVEQVYACARRLKQTNQHPRGALTTRLHHDLAMTVSRLKRDLWGVSVPTSDFQE